METHKDRAQYFRKRAGELSVDAGGTEDEKARGPLMERAQDYDEMAAGREAIAMTIIARAALLLKPRGERMEPE